jgi:hypothetical protein
MVRVAKCCTNHNVYVNEGSPEEVTAFQTFKKTIFEARQLRIFGLELKNNSIYIWNSCQYECLKPTK